MLELELHALKTELQSTLAHLSIVCVSSEESDKESRNCFDVSPLTATAETNDTKTKWRRLRKARHSNTNRPITRWNRRQLIQELAAVSEKRRELQLQLQRERTINESQLQEQEECRRNRRRSTCQTAILKLQQQRARTLRQIEHETAVDAAENEERGGMTQTRPLERQSNSETQYSIGGVVTLEPLSSLQQFQVSAIRTDVSLHPTADAASVATQVRDTHSRLPYRSTPGALNEAFLLQLKLAETISKLDKSVQIRDQLLQHDRTSSLSRSTTGTQLIEETKQADHRSRYGRRFIKSEASSDSSDLYQEKHSDESFSSSAYSYSLVDSTPHRDQTIRVRCPNHEVSRATTAETLAPFTLDGDNSPSEESIDRVSMISASIMTQSPHESLGDNRDSVVEHTASDEQESEVHRTPTTESIATTPTTGSEQKSTSSLSKQVRFGDDAYSTPVLARKFNFDGPSINDDGYVEKDEEAGSVLSFLGGSSVASAELNDVSFLRAFERFRRELSASRLNSATQSLLRLPLARKLFPEQNVSKAIETTNIAPEGVQGNTVEFIGEANACGNITTLPALDGLSIEELQVRRRQLCLDIQAESAQLVLNLDKVQNIAAGSQDAEQTQNRLLTMRDELNAVDVRFQSLV